MSHPAISEDGILISVEMMMMTDRVKFKTCETLAISWEANVFIKPLWRE